MAGRLKGALRGFVGNPADGQGAIFGHEGTARCVSCDSANAVDARYCDGCGAPVLARGASRETPSGRAQDREPTIERDALGRDDTQREFGPLVPEQPIGGSWTPSGPAAPEGAVHTPAPGPEPRPAIRSGGGVPAEFRGTVRNVTVPQPNGHPWLWIDVTAEDGRTVAIRAFFWIYFRAPYVAEGHYIRVGGRATRRGYFKPRFIANETTGSNWHRSRLPLVFVVLLVIGAVLLAAGLL